MFYLLQSDLGNWNETLKRWNTVFPNGRFVNNSRIFFISSHFNFLKCDRSILVFLKKYREDVYNNKLRP